MESLFIGYRGQRIGLHKEKLLGFWKYEFSKPKTENGRKQIIEDLADFLRKNQPDIYNDKEQIEIDDKLGYLPKNRDEEMKKVRMSVIEFIAQKIENESNKEIDVSHMASLQIIDGVEVLRRMWRRIRGIDA